MLIWYTNNSCSYPHLPLAKQSSEQQLFDEPGVHPVPDGSQHFPSLPHMLEQQRLVEFAAEHTVLPLGAHVHVPDVVPLQ